MEADKRDQTRRAGREDFPLPEEWRALIGRRKIILYGGGREALLGGGEGYLKKLRFALKVFRGRDDAALWWRPHPLSEAMYAATRPDLLSEYRQIVADYRRAGWGIFDDGPDPNRAAAWSDVYYGDWSSVADLCVFRGKRAFIAHHAAGREKYLCGSDFFPLTMFVHQNALYSFILDKNLMLKTDLATVRTECLSGVPGKNPVGWKLYHHFQVIGDKVILVPFCDDDIAVYDFRNKTYEIYALTLERKYAPQPEKENFFNVCPHKKKLFLIPFMYRAMVAYTPETGETEHCLDLSALFPVEEDPLMFHHYAYLDDATILLPSLRSNKLLEFNLDTYEYAVHRIGRDHYQLNSIHRHNGAFWMVCLNRLNIIKWNYEDLAITEFDRFPEGCETRNAEKAYFNARGIFLYQNKLICFPSHCNMAVECNLDTGAIRKLDAFDQCLAVEPAYADASLTDTAVLSGRLIYFFYGNRKIFCYDIEAETMREICDVPPPLAEADIQKVNGDYVDAMIRDASVRRLLSHEGSGSTPSVA